MDDVHAAVKQLREALGGFTQERLARHLGVTTRTVARWESSGALIPESVIRRLRSIALSIDANDIAGVFHALIEAYEGRAKDPVPMIPFNDPLPRTPEERFIVAAVLKAYRETTHWANLSVQLPQIDLSYSPPATAAATSDIDGRETAAVKKLEQGAGR